jgi:hypothetical protein
MKIIDAKSGKTLTLQKQQVTFEVKKPMSIDIVVTKSPDEIFL